MEFQNIETFARFLWKDTISEAQVTLLRVLYGMPLTRSQKAMWRTFTEQGMFSRYNPREYSQALALLGRQSGKSSRIGVTCALWESLCVPREISAGSRVAVQFFAPTLRQSTFDQVVEKLRATPELAEMIENDAAASGEVRLTNGVDLISITANPRTARGRASILAVIDEAAYIRTDTAFEMNLPELLESISPSLIVWRGKLLLLSSPSAAEGPLWEAYENRKQNPDVLVWRAPSRAMNPAIDPALLAKERKRGDAYYRREYLAEFVESANPFLPEAAITNAIQRGVAEFPPDANDVCYGAVDTADKRDSNAMAIATVREIDGVKKVVLMKTQEWKPVNGGHNVLKILEEMGAIFQTYRARKVRGDQKNMSVCDSLFSSRGINFERVITEGQGSEQAYRTFLALLNSGQLVLPDESVVIGQMRKLEEKTGDGNRFLVRGRRGARDDVAVAAVTAVALAAEGLNVGNAPTMTAIFTDRPTLGSDDWGWEKLNPDGTVGPQARIPSFGRQRTI